MTSEPIKSERPSSPSSDDLSDYFPANDAAAEALLDEAMSPPKVAPRAELVERLQQLDDSADGSKPGPVAKRPIEATVIASPPRRRWPIWWAYAAVAAVL